MVPSSSKTALLRLFAQRFPAVDTAGFHCEPIKGLSSESWRVLAEGRWWLARPQTTHGGQMGTRRQREYQLLRQMSACQLAPMPLVCRDGWLIVAWQEGGVLSSTEFMRQLEVGALAQLLARLHRQPRCGYHWSLPALFAQHWQGMDPSRRTPAMLRWHHRFQHAVLPDALAYGPLHLDVHANNVLLTPDRQLMLIDWEYAADGDIGLELALVMQGNGLDVQQRQRFLRSYQQQRPGLSLAALARSVAQWLPWVDYLTVLWCEVRWQQTRQEMFLTACAAQRRRLELVM